MAALSGSYAVHATLTADTVDNVTLSENRADYVEVSNYSTTADIRCTTDGTTPGVAQATDCYLIKPGITKLIKSGNGPDYVNLISTGAAPYSVTGAV